MSPTETPRADMTPRLPGRIAYRTGTAADYVALTRHHYRISKPATFCKIVVATYEESHRPRRTIGVAVLSWPVPMVRARNRHFALPPGYGTRLRFANANLRTISRVIVHPQFRALGIATALVAELIARCPTRYVECSAAMGRYATFLRAAGMTRIDVGADEPAYFLFDRRTVYRALARDSSVPRAGELTATQARHKEFAMTTKQRAVLQDTFLNQCRASTQTLDEILEEMEVPPETLAGWLMDDAFRQRLHAMRQELRRKRELQVQIGAARAAAELTRTVDGTDPRASAVRRAACVDLIRLARDSRARRRATDMPPDEYAREYRALYHSAISPDEAQELMEQLARNAAAANEAAKQDE